MKIRYLFDENLSPRFVTVLKRYYPLIDARRVGDEQAPPLRATDPEILQYLEQTQRTLVTDNRKSMPRHLADHLAEGGHHYGIFIVSKNSSNTSAKWNGWQKRFLKRNRT